MQLSNIEHKVLFTKGRGSFILKRVYTNLPATGAHITPPDTIRHRNGKHQLPCASELDSVSCAGETTRNIRLSELEIM